MNIGELSARTQVGARLLRYYEAQGLLAPERSRSGYRLYAEPDVARVKTIRLLLGAGLNTNTIAKVLSCAGSNLNRLCPAALDELRHRRERLASTIADLRKSASLLDDLILNQQADDSERARPPQSQVASLVPR
ncbi:MerR family transcriptional regulator [Arthrobacter bambusae]